MDAAAFADRLGAALDVTIGGDRRPMSALDVTDTHVMLADWAAPPGDGSWSNARWVDLADVDAVDGWTFDPKVTAADPPVDDPSTPVDPYAITYPDPPQEATP